jgi:glycine oxidase
MPHVASGRFGHGILFALAVAEVLSRLILERTAAPPAFDLRRIAIVRPAAPLAETPHGDVSDEADVWCMGS